MRVALLKMHSASKGGLEKYASRIASAFAKRGDEVFLLTTQEPETPQFGVEPVSFPVCRWPGFLRLEQFDRCVRRWLKKNPMEIVFGLERNREQTHLRAGGGVHAAYLCSRIESEGLFKYALCQINPQHRKLLELEKTAIHHPGLKKVFVNSRMVRDEWLQYYGVDPKKIEVIHNGVEWKELEERYRVWPQQRDSFLAAHGLDKETFHLLFIGNGYRRKGLWPLLLALAKWRFKDFHLSVIGKEKQSGRYQEMAKRLGLERRVRFFGPQKEIIPFYQMADVLAVPSFYDPFANVTIEALSFGLFVISSKTNGGSEILTEKTGCILERIEPDAILSALERALTSRKTAQIAEAIRASVSHLDFPVQLEKMIDACT